MEIVEFRCFFCDSLTSRVSIDSLCETKCRRCKEFSYFIKGFTFSEQLIKEEYKKLFIKN